MHIDLIEIPSKALMPGLPKACAELQKQLFPYQAWEASFFETFLFAPYGRGVLALAQEILVGFFLYQHILDEGDVLTFGVSRSFQGKKIGQRLLQRGVQQAKTLNLKTLFLEVKDGNEIPIHLYKKYGFLQVALRPCYYHLEAGNQKDALLFKLIFPD